MVVQVGEQGQTGRDWSSAGVLQFRPTKPLPRLTDVKAPMGTTLAAGTVSAEEGELSRML